jgi:hypothetical protein
VRPPPNCRASGFVQSPTSHAFKDWVSAAECNAIGIIGNRQIDEVQVPLTKSLFATRPIFHKLDETICGHLSCSFLAFVLKKASEDRIMDLGKPGSWPEILADLDSLTEVEVEQDNTRFLLRSTPCPAASLALRAVGVALPPTVRR